MKRKSRVAIGCALIALGLPSAALADSLTPPSSTTPVAPGTVVDRDEFSTTTQTSDDKLHTVVSSQPVNYQDDAGDWQAIDTSLQDVNGVAHPAGVDGDLAIPASLSQPVTLQHDDQTLSFRLIGAGGERQVDDETASFDDALRGVDVSYSSRASGVEEQLQLASPTSTQTFHYDLRASALWSVAIEGHDVVVRDSSGTERYRMTAPLAWDSASDPSYTNDLALSVAKVTDGRWLVTLTPRAAWLNDADRVYPITIDPDFSWSNGTTRMHGATDCYLASLSQANNKFCASTTLQTGYYNRAYNAIYKFDVASAIPSNATVSAAQFMQYQPGSTVRLTAQHRLRTITSDWDSNATWNNRKTGVAWATPGGDVSSNAAYTSSTTAVNNAGYWYYWAAPIAAVQGWIAGSLPNYGFQLTTEPGSPSTTAYVWTSTEGDQAYWPALDITWSTADTAAPTAITPSGELWNDGDHSVPGTTTIPVSVSAQDDKSGVASFQLVLDGAAVGTPTAVSCPNNTCPLSASGSLSLASTSLAEGAHTIAIRVKDKTGNSADSSTWSIYVDRTAPSFPPDPTPGPDESELNGLTINQQNGTSYAEWFPADDPDLADGSTSGGVYKYSVRYRVTGTTAWSASTDVTNNELGIQIPGTASSYDLELTPVDTADNRGTPKIRTVTPFIPDPTPDTANTYNVFPPQDVVSNDPVPTEGPYLVESSSFAAMSARATTTNDNTNMNCDNAAWGPIQNHATMFVVGACPPNTAVKGFRRTHFDNFPGQVSEGMDWEAVAAFNSDGTYKTNFHGCGWMSVAKRLLLYGHSKGKVRPCNPDHQLGEFIAQYVTTPNAPPYSDKHHGFAIWSTVNSDGDEKNGAAWHSVGNCQVWGNYNPWVRDHPKVKDRLPISGTNSAPLVIPAGGLVYPRYLAKTSSLDPDQPADTDRVYWVMVHTTDTYSPWGFVSEKCLFGVKEGDVGNT